MVNFDLEPGSDPGPRPRDPFAILRNSPASAQKVVHALLNGKHIDPFLAEEFRFLESYPEAWEELFEWLGYRLKKRQLGGMPFFYLDPRTEMASQSRLSRGATFLGLYLAWHFFLQGPGESDAIPAEDIFRRLTSSYDFHFLRSIFLRRSGGNPTAVEPSQDQVEKLRGYMKREILDLARYRFIDVRPNMRAAWDDLTVHRLPALYRFWELALHARGGNGNGRELDIDEVVAQVWGRVESEPERPESGPEDEYP